jgi:malate dehydrogenase
MERKDLLSANGAIFTVQGKAINDHAARTCARARRRQPGQHQRADCHAQRARRAGRRFTAMTRLDHNRAMSQLADQGLACP